MPVDIEERIRRVESNERWIADLANGVIGGTDGSVLVSFFGSHLRFPIRGYGTGQVDLIPIYALPQAERHAALIDAIRDVMRDAGLLVASGG